MFTICKIPAKSALDYPSIQFRLNGICVEMFFGWDNSEGEQWKFSLTLNHPLLGFSIDENGGTVGDIARLIRDMNEELELEGVKTVGFFEMDELVPAIVEAVKPAYLNSPNHSASDDYSGV
jgi:hypothetical protein